MSTVVDTVEGVRDELRALHQKIDAGTAKNHAAIRVDLEDASRKAQHLAGSLRTLAKDQRTDASDHLAHAAKLLQSAAANAKEISAANAETIREGREALSAHTRTALRNVTEAIAAKRSALKSHAK